MKPLAFVTPFLFLFTPLAFAQEAPAEDPSCVKYVYADISGPKDRKAPVFACRKITNNRAGNCFHIGSIDMAKMENAKTRALDKMWAFSRGLGAGFACQVGATAAPLIMGPFKTIGSAGIAADRSSAKNQMREIAKKNVLDNKREPGTPPSAERGEVVETNVTKGCAWVRQKVTGNTSPSKITETDAFNLGVDTVLSHFASSAAMSAVLAGDALAIEKMYPDPHGENRKKAVKEFHARIERERKKQEAVLKAVKEKADIFFHFMTDKSESTLPFGTSPEGVANNLTCINPIQIREVAKKLCGLAKATAKMETYVPGDLFDIGRTAAKPIEGAESITKNFVRENCRGDSAQEPGILEKSEPGFPLDI